MMRVTKLSARVFLTVLTLTACGDPGAGNQVGSTTTTAAPFPYPPVQFLTDIAIPIDGQLRTAIEFALETTVMDWKLLDERYREKLLQTFRSRIASDALLPSEWTNPPDFVDDTGGETLRAIGAKELGDDVIEVTICSYNVPGIYILKNDGRIESPDPTVGLYGLAHPRVQWTSRPAADGSAPSGPRWLWVDDGIDLSPNKPRNLAQQVCEPFKPEPFEQKMPDPTPPAATPTR
ncbi:hypothetical protein [Nocardia sp. bgisy118]|uniref:hypothetical protein n=1 Tax=Nocardia sp. bgisy118 TaxID=3413786 RepID=UPI003F4A66A2